MKKGILLIISLIAGSSLGAMRPGDFLCTRTLTAPDPLSGNLASCYLDSLVYRNTAKGFSDMRIFDDSGKEIAFVVRAITSNDTDTVRQSIPLRREQFQPIKGGGASVVYSRMQDDSIPTRLTIITQTRNFEKAITILGSDDGTSWEPIAQKQPIFDYTQFMDIRNTTIEFPRAAYRLYKVRIDSVWNFKRSPFSRIIHETSGRNREKQYTEFMHLQEPFRIDRINFSGEAKRVRNGNPVSRTTKLQIDSTSHDTTQKSTLIYLSSNREPIDNIQLSVSAGNFIRQVRVYATDESIHDDTRWIPIGSGEIMNISTDNYERSELRIPVGTGARYRHFKLRIMNKDNAPISVSAVSGEGPRHEVLFFHRDARQFRLCYGAKDAAAPQYDVGAVLHRSPMSTGALWVLGSESKSAVEKNASSGINEKHLLMGALGLMVVVLGVVLGVAVRKVDEKTV